MDEIYDAAIVQPIQHRCRSTALWKGVDARVIDGAVNGVGEIVSRLSDVAAARCRPARSARTPRRCCSGVVLMLGYYLWR